MVSLKNLGTVAGSTEVNFLYIHLRYGGKTVKCHPKDKFPDKFYTMHLENHL